jgi:hypothetical protein
VACASIRHWIGSIDWFADRTRKAVEAPPTMGGLEHWYERLSHLQMRLASSRIGRQQKDLLLLLFAVGIIRGYASKQSIQLYRNNAQLDIDPVRRLYNAMVRLLCRNSM